MARDGVVMTAAVDTMRLAVGDDLGEFERKNFAFLVADGFKDTARLAIWQIEAVDKALAIRISARCLELHPLSAGYLAISAEGSTHPELSLVR